MAQAGGGCLGERARACVSGLVMETVSSGLHKLVTICETWLCCPSSLALGQLPLNFSKCPFSSSVRLENNRGSIRWLSGCKSDRKALSPEPGMASTEVSGC